MIRVYASGDTFAAALMRGHLEAEGITVLEKGEGGGPYRMGPVYLFVPSEDADRARELVAAVESGALAISDEDVMAPVEGEAD